MSLKEAARGAALLTLGCLGIAAVLLAALLAARPIFQVLGMWGIVGELAMLMFAVGLASALCRNLGARRL